MHNSQDVGNTVITLFQEVMKLGLDNSIRSGARTLAPLIGSGVALWFGLRGTFVATAIVFMFGTVIAIWFLPKPVQLRDADVVS